MENSTNTTLVVEGDPFSEWMVDTSIDRTVTGLLWSLVAVVTFVVNTFVCIYTIIYWCMRRRRTTIPKYTTQQSSLLLFFLCFLFAVESLLIFPFIVVAASSGEWLVYQSVDSKVVTCTIIGITLNGVYSAGVWTLGALSLERFLFVSQPHIHKNKFTNKVGIITHTACNLCRQYSIQPLLYTAFVRKVQSNSFSKYILLDRKYSWFVSTPGS